ncbi:hypothetical protein J3E69DRAFT_279665 [Trichoderma sp. SZMC 28015]
MQDKCIEENSRRPDIIESNSESYNYKDRVLDWVAGVGDLEVLDDTLNNNDDAESDKAKQTVDSSPEISLYKRFLSGHPVYKWLLGNIRRVLYMEVPGNVQIRIRNSILKHLPEARRVSRRAMPERCNFTFTVDWDPCLFLRQQKYLERPEVAIGRAITITGSETDAQATTVMQYLLQTWPSSGIHLLDLLKIVVQDACNIPYSFYLVDRTQYIVLSRGPRFTLQVVGMAETIVEIGEQLTWLASALRPSSPQTELILVEAHAKSRQLNESPIGSNAQYLCDISFVESPIATSQVGNGQCWHRLFQSPVVVKGYPIPRRPTYHKGLEIGIDVMATLVGTNRINIFKKKIFIKGFSTMMIPTGYSDNILFWHLIYNEYGDRISYLDSKVSHLEGINSSDIESVRHILGWSSEVRCLSGTSDANYEINRSGLPYSHEGCKMNDISISHGQVIKSSNFRHVTGKRDTPSYILSDYMFKLVSLSKEYVIFWDVDTKRGWLVNGTTALLHLLRASLEYNKTDDANFKFLFESDNFKEAQSPGTNSAVMQVLMDEENLKLELYEVYDLHDINTKKKYLVSNRISDLYETLEKIIDHQRDIAGEDGKLLKDAPRKDLEGWDFKDIATKQDSIKPLLAKIKTIGKGWIDFTRSIQAATLFGEGFGELIEPIRKTDLCGYWTTLPSKKYYLAASMEDIKRIIDRLGNSRTNPPRLTRSQVWAPFKRDASLSCECAKGMGRHCELTQTIWPLRMRKRVSKEMPLPAGAVVFGYNSLIRMIWKDTGHPEDGEPPLSGEESDDDGPADSGDDPADSGVGLNSCAPTTAERRENPLTYDDYKTGIICALPKELAAVEASFDEHHQCLPQLKKDTNSYCLGSIGTQNVVAACLPYEEYGINAAAKVASDMDKTFTTLERIFLVGIGGGIPSEDHDIRLGDVVVGTSIIQHDMGKAMQKDSRLLRTGPTQRPDTSLRTAISKVKSHHNHSTDFLETHIQHILASLPEYGRPQEGRDRLFEGSFHHEEGQNTCQNCSGPEVIRESRTPRPHVHYGIIACGSQVVKDASLRDEIGTELKAICIEMEATGVMTTGRCLIIRGICDYADSHKNDDWHNYAAASAAAYMKHFILHTAT